MSQPYASTGKPFSRCLAVLAVANVLNNRVARRWVPLTSAVATGALLMIARRDGLTWSELGFRRAGRGAATGGVLAVGVGAVYLAALAHPRTRPLLHDERALALSRRRLLEEVLLQVPVGTVLLEEVGFRGALPAVLGRRWAPGTAAAVSAALFGLWHVLPAVDMARANPAVTRLASADHTGPAVGTARLVAGTVAGTGLAGFALHALGRHSGLLAPALTHLAVNSLGYAAARIARRMAPADTC